ncbi:MAG: peptide-methionine (S)-S-oxide reductase MsrA [Patescibacteria group bacterium]
MKNETIIFASGCFWCTEAVFQMLRGVNSVTSGYTGGEVENPRYQEVSGGGTGHAEAIKVEFDPSVVSLQDLLAVFFSTHDPTTPNRQGHDIGPQYRSAIFYTTPEQKKMIEDYIQELTNNQTFSKPIVTEVKSAATFYPAENYHQNYYQNNREQGYCQVIIDPKIAKLRQQYAHLLKKDKNI